MPRAKVTQSISEGTVLSAPVTWEAFPTKPGFVSFYIDSQPKWEEDSAPYIYGGDGNKLDPATLSPGEHALAVDLVSGNVLARSAEVTVTVVHAPPSGVPRAGISVGGTSLWRSATDMKFELDQIRDVGAKVVRVDCDPAQSHVDATVRFVDQVIARGMEPLVIIGGWLQAPMAEVDWRTFVAKVRDTFVPKGVRLFETPNEPNNGTGFTPVTLARAAVIAYEELKKGYDGSAFLGVGGLSLPATSIFQWTKDMYANGVAGHLDAFTVHAYDDPADHGSWSAWDVTFGNQLTWPDPSNVRSVMAAHGDGGKPIWSTESGGPTPKYSLAKQAQIVTNGLTDSRPEMTLVFTMMDDDVAGFGLLAPDRSKRPAWNAFRAAA